MKASFAVQIGLVGALLMASVTFAAAQTLYDGVADRAGVSLIVLGSDNKGVELAFWEDEVWTQGNAFLHTVGSGENHVFNTTSGRIHYALDVANGSYALSGNGTALLGGKFTFVCRPCRSLRLHQLSVHRR